MLENTYPSLFNEFFELSPSDYAKMLIDIKNTDKNIEMVAEIKDRISALKDRIKKNMSETEKKIKMLIRHWRLLKKFLIIIKNFFCLHQKLIKENQNQNLKKELQIG